jgi:hypothetical protein
MRKRRVASIMFAGAAVAATGTVMNAGVAHAATSNKWTLTPGGTLSGIAGTTSLKDVTADVALTCTSAAAAGSLSKTTYTQTTSASFSAGKLTGTFGSANKACTGPLGLKFDATLSAATLNAKSEKSGITHGKLTGIKATIHGVGVSCTAPVTGSQPYSYNNATHTLTVLGNSTADSLTTGTVTGCLGVIKTGDKNFFKGAYSVSPAQTITETS